MPYVAQSAEHQRLEWIAPNSEQTVIVDSKVTGGQLAIMQLTADAGWVTPMHIHSVEDELFLVLDGAITVWVGDERQDVGPGGVAFLPRGIAHALRVSSRGSRILQICTPGGFEGFIRELGRDRREIAEPGWSVTPAMMAEAGARHGCPVVGPPPDDGAAAGPR